LAVLNLFASKPFTIEDVSMYYKVLKYSEDSEKAAAALRGEGASMNISMAEALNHIADMS
jgi:hypothetical protein